MLINVFFKAKREFFFEKNFYTLNSFFPSADHKIFQRMGYYLLKLGTKRFLVNFEYIEYLEKKNLRKIMIKRTLIYWKNYIIKIQVNLFFFD